MAMLPTRDPINTAKHPSILLRLISPKPITRNAGKNVPPNGPPISSRRASPTASVVQNEQQHLKRRTFKVGYDVLESNHLRGNGSDGGYQKRYYQFCSAHGAISNARGRSKHIRDSNEFGTQEWELTGGTRDCLTRPTQLNTRQYSNKSGSNQQNSRFPLQCVGQLIDRMNRSRRRDVRRDSALWYFCLPQVLGKLRHFNIHGIAVSNFVPRPWAKT